MSADTPDPAPPGSSTASATGASDAAADGGSTPAGDTTGRFAVVHRSRVRWVEADPQGVVFNGHYLTYFDVAVTEYWRAVAAGDDDWFYRTLDRLYVVRSTLDYLSPARFDDRIDTAIRCARLGRTSLTFEYEIRRGDTRLVSGQTIYVHTDAGHPAPLPDELRARIVALEPLRPD